MVALPRSLYYMYGYNQLQAPGLEETVEYANPKP